MYIQCCCFIHLPEHVLTDRLITVLPLPQLLTLSYPWISTDLFSRKTVTSQSLRRRRPPNKFQIPHAFTTSLSASNKKGKKNNVHTDRNENYPSRFNWQQLFCKRRHDLPFIHCSLQVNMDNEHSDDCKQLYSRKYVFCNSSNLTFARSAYLSPKCCNLEPSRPSAFKSLNRIADTDCAFLSDVKGDGRCGYRALAKAVGVSYRCIMQTLVDLMIRSPKEFTAANVLQMIMAMDENNACPRSCWLSGAHISHSCPNSKLGFAMASSFATSIGPSWKSSFFSMMAKRPNTVAFQSMQAKRAS